MSIRRVAVIFDDQIRPDTAGVYVRRRWPGWSRSSISRPDGPTRSRRTGFDLYLSIDDDSEHRLPPELRPRAYWAIDTHTGFHRPAAALGRLRPRVRRAARRCRAAAGRRHRIGDLAAAGVRPGIHRKHEVAKQYDVAFVGTYLPRAEG